MTAGGCVRAVPTYRPGNSPAGHRPPRAGCPAAPASLRALRPIAPVPGLPESQCDAPGDQHGQHQREPLVGRVEVIARITVESRQREAQQAQCGTRRQAEQRVRGRAGDPAVADPRTNQEQGGGQDQHPGIDADHPGLHAPAPMPAAIALQQAERQHEQVQQHDRQHQQWNQQQWHGSAVMGAASGTAVTDRPLPGARVRGAAGTGRWPR